MTLTTNPELAYTLGQKGTVTLNAAGSTTELDVDACLLQIITDATFSAITDAGESGDSLAGVELAAGTVIGGRFTAATISAGIARFYRS